VELAKKKQQKPKREVTKRQLSRWQQQKKRQRLIFGLGILIIVAVLGIVGGGVYNRWYIPEVKPLRETVIIVNDASFNMKYYINILKYSGRGQSTDFLYYLADAVVTIIQQNELVRQGAEELGIRVSDAEVDEELKNLDLPTRREYRDLIRAEMLTTKLRDEYFEHQVPLLAEQGYILAMLLENEKQATEVRARLEAGEDFTELAGELSLEAISQTENGDFGWQLKDLLSDLLKTSIPVDYAFDAQVGVLSQPIYDEETTKSVGYWLIKMSEREEDSDLVHVQAILLGSEEEAQEVKARLGTGEDFAALAEDLSQHEGSKENSGDIGWSVPGTMSPAFDEFAFNSEVELETVSESIRDDTMGTTGGYWLVKVLDKDDNRKIEDDDRTLLKSKALEEWISSLWDDPENKIESYLDEDQKSWAILKAVEELEQ
jgi:parvulin-like peptidyl-prolyl isomerase